MRIAAAHSVSVWTVAGFVILTSSLALDAKADGALQPLRDYPFSKGSIWNVPIGEGAAYQPDLPGNETSLIRNPDPFPDGGKPHAYPWLGRDVMTVYQATLADPQVRWHYQRRPQYLPWPSPNSDARAGGQIVIRTPNGFSGQTVDGWSVIFEPAGRYYFETWLPKVSRTDGSLERIDVSFLAYNDACGTGFPNNPSMPWRHDGVRAPGISLLGGLIRKKELDTGLIPHAVAMVISQWQLKAARTQPEQVVWPAYHTDTGSVENYRGVIPMGSLFAIDAKADLTTMGIKTREGMMLATAYRDYGGYVVDTADKTFVIASLETGVAAPVADALQQDIETIRNHLSLVSNNASSAQLAAETTGSRAPVPVGGGGAPLVRPPERGCM